MREDKRLIDANALLDKLIRIERGCLDIDSDFAKGIRECQHAVISANTEHADEIEHPFVRITAMGKSCPHCGHIVMFEMPRKAPKNNKGGIGNGEQVFD